jgi:GxxExxY protein
MEINKITERILKSAFSVHSELGPGLLESSYRRCHAYEMTKDGLYVESEVKLPLRYKEITLETGYRLDLWVEKKVIVETKAVEAFNEVHLAQLLTYLKLAGCKVGLLINFNVASLRNGIRRVII